MNKDFWEIWLDNEKVRETDFQNYLKSKKIKLETEKEVLSKSVSGKIQDLLVHRYGKVDEDVEYPSIRGNHKDVIAFIEDIELFLKKDIV